MADLALYLTGVALGACLGVLGTLFAISFRNRRHG